MSCADYFGVGEKWFRRVKVTSCRVDISKVDISKVDISKVDIIPKLKSENVGLTAEKWVRKVELIGRAYYWHDRILMLKVIGKLIGATSFWFDCGLNFIGK